VTIAYTLAETINPFLIGAWVSLVIARTGTKSQRSFAASSIIALAFSVSLAELGKAHGVWPGDPGFPSGHETFGASVAVSLLRADRRWTLLAAAACLLLAWALVFAHYHKPVDVFGGLALGTLVTMAVHKVALRRTA
jgi:membrane-associated phospholipid phosphatase